MSVTWETIQSDWLLGQTLSLSQSEVLERFVLLEDVLGERWLSDLKNRPGLVPSILRALLMADKVAFLRTSAGVSDVLERIKAHDPAAHSELTAAYLLCSPDCEIEFGPEVTVKNRLRRPDLRIRPNDKDWCYVEVASPSESELQAKAQELVSLIANRLAQTNADMVLDCILLKEPSAEEVDDLCNRIGSIVAASSATVERIPDLAIVAFNQSAPGQAVIADYGAPLVPRHAISTFQMDMGQTRKTISVRIPFADERAEGFITHEARQLPEDHPGLLMFDMTVAASGMTAWKPLLSRRLQPNQHTRVSAICLFTGNFMIGPHGFGWYPQVTLVRNPYARHAIYQSIATRLEAIRLPQMDHG